MVRWDEGASTPPLEELTPDLTPDPSSLLHTPAAPRGTRALAAVAGDLEQRIRFAVPNRPLRAHIEPAGAGALRGQAV